MDSFNFDVQLWTCDSCGALRQWGTGDPKGLKTGIFLECWEGGPHGRAGRCEKVTRHTFVEGYSRTLSAPGFHKEELSGD